ncbi:MAG: hypothetical protein ACTSQ8_13505 [Candidatus Helarchaeota archaeon]
MKPGSKYYYLKLFRKYFPCSEEKPSGSLQLLKYLIQCYKEKYLITYESLALALHYPNFNKTVATKIRKMIKPLVKKGILLEGKYCPKCHYSNGNKVYLRCPNCQKLIIFFPNNSSDRNILHDRWVYKTFTLNPKYANLLIFYLTTIIKKMEKNAKRLKIFLNNYSEK